MGKSGRETQEGGDIYIIMTELGCTAETKATL